MTPSNSKDLTLRSPSGLVLAPTDVAFVDAIALSVHDGHDGRTKLVLAVRAQRREPGLAWPQHEASFISLELQFTGVRDISLGRLATLPHQVEGFDIIDLSEAGMEDIALEVLDFEKGSLHWLAGGVRATEGWMVS